MDECKPLPPTSTTAAMGKATLTSVFSKNCSLSSDLAGWAAGAALPYTQGLRVLGFRI